MRRWVGLVLFLVGCGGSGSSGPTGDLGDMSSATDYRSESDVTTGDGAVKDSVSEVTDDSQAGCVDGDHACFSESAVSVCVNGVFQFSKDCGDESQCIEGQCVKPAQCTPGSVTGCDNLGYQWVCIEDGTGVASQACPENTMCVQGECRGVVCTPGTSQCVSSSSIQKCLEDGSGYGPVEICEIGKTCVSGFCMSLCEADIKQNTNVGCQYWAVDLDNDPTHHPLFPNQPTPEFFPHSVVISNPGTSDVVMSFSIQVACEDGSACSPTTTTCNGLGETVCDLPADQEYEIVVADPVVPAGQSREFKMPVMNVSGSGISPKAIRIMASQPVVAYQFNPFNSENAASNDGSLLLPQNALGKLYYAVSLPSRGAIMGFPANNGFLTVVATVPDTTVQVTPTVKVFANPTSGVPQDGTTPEFLSPGVTYSFNLQLFDVLNLEQMAEGGIVTPGTIPKDLTGSRIESDKPVAVFSGHQVAGIQEALKAQITDIWDTCCTEHLEEQLMPVETWGTQALCVKSKPRGYETDRFVVVAGDDNVLLSTDPPLDGLDGQTLVHAGDQLRIETDESFVLTATGRIQVVQFLMSQGQTQPIGGEPGTGDPSMMILPPSSQYRDEYVIRTADGFGTNWVTVIRPNGVQVQIDGAAVSEGSFEPLGDGTFEFSYQQVATGNHRITAEQPFGLMVYGYGTVTAYGYPGGMNLEQ